MKYRFVKKMPHLKVPVLNEQPGTVPLNGLDMLVYGYLLFLVRKGNGVGLTRLSRSLQLDRVAAKRALARLVRSELASVEEGIYRAVEPPPSAREWFRYLKNASGEWFEQLVYDRVWLPQSSQTLSVRTNLLFWRLYRLGEEIKGMPHCLQVGNSKKAYPRYVTDTYLARAIRCERKTIHTGLKRLSDLGLITCVPRKKGFAVAIHSLESNVHLWRPAWTRKKASEEEPLTVRQLFGVPSSVLAESEDTPFNKILKRLRRYGITGRLAEEVVVLIHDNELPTDEWIGLLDKASSDHNSNRANGAAKATHCGFLFRFMVNQYIQQRELEKACSAPVQYATADEMRMQEALMPLRLSEDAKTLLNVAIGSNSLQYEDGRSIPCPISCQSVEKAAKEAAGDWAAFKAGILSQVFNGKPKEAEGCIWLQAWMMVEQEETLPEVNDEPLKALGLNSWECREVRNRIHYFYGSETTRDAIEFTDQLVQLAVWQAGTVKERKPVEQVVAAVENIVADLNKDSGNECGSEESGYVVVSERSAEIGRRWKESWKKTPVA